MPYNSVTESFHKKNFIADFLRKNALLDGKWPFGLLKPPSEA